MKTAAIATIVLTLANLSFAAPSGGGGEGEINKRAVRTIQVCYRKDGEPESQK